MPLVPWHIGPSPSDDTIIWKYFPRWQFDSLVNDRALFFRRVIDYLRDDPNEGAIPKRDQEYDKRAALYRHFRDPHRTFEDLRREVEIAESVKGWGMHYTTVINCWTMRQTESRLMWIGYAGVSKRTHGVAVRSTVGKLRESLKHQSNDIYTSSIRYIDYDNDRFDEGTGNVMSPMLHKNKHGYADELELRLLYSHQGTEPFRGEDLWDEYENCRATKIGVDLNELLCEVVMSPNATDVELEQVKSMCVKNGISPAITRFRYSHLHPMDFKFEVV